MERPPLIRSGPDDISVSPRRRQQAQTGEGSVVPAFGGKVRVFGVADCVGWPRLGSTVSRGGVPAVVAHRSWWVKLRGVN